MGNTNTVPVISQTKSLVQLATGDKEGAKTTQEKFLHECPLVAQATSVVELAVNKDKDQFINTNLRTLRILSNVADGIPVVGHVKGAIHAVAGDRRGARNAIKSANRSTGVASGGVVGFLALGPIGAIAGGIAGGATVDGLQTGVESAICHEFRPNGSIAAVSNAVCKPSGGAVFDVIAMPVFDALGGFSAGQLTAQIQSGFSNGNVVITDTGVNDGGSSSSASSSASSSSSSSVSQPSSSTPSSTHSSSVASSSSSTSSSLQTSSQVSSTSSSAPSAPSSSAPVHSSSLPSSSTHPTSGSLSASTAPSSTSTAPSSASAGSVSTSSGSVPSSMGSAPSSSISSSTSGSVPSSSVTGSASSTGAVSSSTGSVSSSSVPSSTGSVSASAGSTSSATVSSSTATGSVPTVSGPVHASPASTSLVPTSSSVVQTSNPSGFHVFHRPVSIIIGDLKHIVMDVKQAYQQVQGMDGKIDVIQSIVDPRTQIGIDLSDMESMQCVLNWSTVTTSVHQLQVIYDQLTIVEQLVSTFSATPNTYQKQIDQLSPHSSTAFKTILLEILRFVGSSHIRRQAILDKTVKLSRRVHQLIDSSEQHDISMLFDEREDTLHCVQWDMSGMSSSLFEHLGLVWYLILDSPQVLLLNKVEASEYLLTGLTRILGYRFLKFPSSSIVDDPLPGSALLFRPCTYFTCIGAGCESPSDEETPDGFEIVWADFEHLASHEIFRLANLQVYDASPPLVLEAMRKCSEKASTVFACTGMSDVGYTQIRKFGFSECGDTSKRRMSLSRKSSDECILTPITKLCNLRTHVPRKRKGDILHLPRPFSVGLNINPSGLPCSHTECYYGCSKE